MGDSGRVYVTMSPANIMHVPDPTPDVVRENVDAALIMLSGALAALDKAGYDMEHMDGPYGEVFRATVSVIERAFPGADGESILTDRSLIEGDPGTQILESLSVARRQDYSED
ncbi:hypothetical protein E1091_03420 [Micromonospora fluostatini]|uniref:Thiamine-binding protein domain-containing protein n=1 Tax=Micromonospora fluostatini TaxID=1629071 RepID=A0ABY2DKF0_9ACTN|nr:hypothetical protein E1091_03420 [Micromonospora fluostatini]